MNSPLIKFKISQQNDNKNSYLKICNSQNEPVIGYEKIGGGTLNASDIICREYSNITGLYIILHIFNF
jgi:hypothetical protein